MADMKDKWAKYTGTKSPKKSHPKHQEDDDEGGGGHGKAMLGSFKLESLLGALDKGMFKAQQFWRFLNKEGLDAHEIQKTELEKEVEDAADVSEAKEEKAVKETDADSQQTQEKKASAREEAVWKKAAAAGERDSSRFGFLDSHSDPQGVSRQAEMATAAVTQAEDMGRRAAFGDQVQGANFGNHHGDAHGTIRQSWVGQDVGRHIADGIQGSGMQGSVTNAAYFANPHGVTERSGMGGRLFNPLSHNAETVKPTTKATQQPAATKAPPQATNTIRSR